MTMVFLEIILVGVGTYLFRAVSIHLGSRIEWSTNLQTWLSYVTPAVLGALLLPMLLLPNGSFLPIFRNTTLLAAVPAALVAWYTRNLLWTVLSGMVAFAVLTYFVR